MTAQEFVNKKLGDKNYTHSKYPMSRKEIEDWLNEFAERQVKLLATTAVMESLPHTQYRWVCGKCDFSSLNLNWNKCPNCGNVP